MIPLARFLKILINSKSKSCVYISAVNKWNPVNIENTGMRKNDAAMNDVFLLQPWEWMPLPIRRMRCPFSHPGC